MSLLMQALKKAEQLKHGHHEVENEKNESGLSWQSIDFANLDLGAIPDVEENRKSDFPQVAAIETPIEVRHTLQFDPAVDSDNYPQAVPKQFSKTSVNPNDYADGTVTCPETPPEDGAVAGFAAAHDPLPNQEKSDAPPEASMQRSPTLTSTKEEGQGSSLLSVEHAKEPPRIVGEEMLQRDGPATKLKSQYLIPIVVILMAAGTGMGLYVTSRSTKFSAPHLQSASAAMPVTSRRPTTVNTVASADTNLVNGVEVPQTSNLLLKADFGLPKASESTLKPKADISSIDQLPQRNFHDSERPINTKVRSKTLNSISEIYRNTEQQADTEIHVLKSPLSPIDDDIQDAYNAYVNGDIQSAKRRYEQVLRNAPENRDALLGSAAIAMAEGAPQQARRYYERILEIYFDDSDARAGLALIQRGGILTRPEVRDASVKESNNGISAFSLGNMYAAQGRWTEAQTQYFEAFTLAPDNPDCAFNLAVSLDRLRERTLALRYYEIALKLATTRKATFASNDVQRRIEMLRHSK